MASGGLLFSLAAGGAASTLVLQLVLMALLLAWLLKWRYWRFIDTQQPISDTGTATGLGDLGTVTQLEAPHTSENYLLKEMGYVIARKHAARLRRLAGLFGAVLPALFLLAASALQGVGQVGVLSLALATGITGILIERWLFFAEARHAVTLYYGRSL